MDIKPGDRLVLKKEHPCGSREWRVLRAGMDFKLECTGCGRQVMVPRRKIEPNIKEIRQGGDEA